MKYILLISLVINVVSLFVSYLFFKNIKSKKSEISKLEEIYSGLYKEFDTLVQSNKIKSKNKEATDEKIDNLHNGNVVDNAINILRK